MKYAYLISLCFLIGCGSYYTLKETCCFDIEYFRESDRIPFITIFFDESRERLGVYYKPSDPSIHYVFLNDSISHLDSLPVRPNEIFMSNHKGDEYLCYRYKDQRRLSKFVDVFIEKGRVVDMRFHFVELS